MNIFITRPQKKDKEELRNLLSSSIANAYTQDDLKEDEVKKEVDVRLGFLNKDFESNGKDAFFLIAKVNKQIVGVIAYAKANNLIRDNLKIDLNNVPEITVVYILPKSQGKGIGSLLFNAILISLLHKNVEEFCLDGGFKKSQSFWIKKLGKPNVVLRNFWGKIWIT